MKNSIDPLYQKGFKAGRRLTEIDIDALKETQPNRDQWNQIYLTLLPIAFSHGTNWRLGEEKYDTKELIVKLAAALTDEAFKRLH